MPITSSPAHSLPHFAGVKREDPKPHKPAALQSPVDNFLYPREEDSTSEQNSESPSPADHFIYQGEGYSTTGQDSELLGLAHHAEQLRFLDTSNRSMSPLEIIKEHLARKEPNNQFKEALADQYERRAYKLLNHPEVQLSAKDDPQQTLAVRFQDKKNLKFLTRQLGSKDNARAFTQRMLNMAEHSQTDDASSGSTQVEELTAEQLFESLLRTHAGNAAESSSRPVPREESKDKRFLKKLAFWNK